MTVSYQSDVASSSSGGLIRLLFRWRGSIWKLVYRELVFYVITYLAISMLYRFGMDDFSKRIFEKIVKICSSFVEMIPLSFILGFYVSFTATRWWDQFKAIPWPDKLMNNIALYVPGSDENSRMLRRTLMRYINLTLVLVLRSISIPVKRRFPTKEHLVEAGFMTKTELEMFSSVPSTEFNTYWIPCTWFVNLIRQAKAEARVTDSCGLKLIMEEFNDFRANCGLLWAYDWVSIPLVYTQVVTMATYAFFLISVIGRQHIDIDDTVLESKHLFEYYFPVFTILQFFFYMGLLKLGEQLINPFGDDDEDFELNWIIDRHIKVSYLGVDILYSAPPPLVRDPYFDDTDIKLPYTESSLNYKKKTYRGSASNSTHGQFDREFMVVPEFAEDIAGEEQLTDGSRRTSIWTAMTLKTPSSRRTSGNGSWYSVEMSSTGEPQTPGSGGQGAEPFFATSKGGPAPASTSAVPPSPVGDAKTSTGIKGDSILGSKDQQKTKNTLEVPLVGCISKEPSSHFSRQFSSPPGFSNYSSFPTTVRKPSRNLESFVQYMTPKWLQKRPRHPRSLLRIKGNEIRVRPFRSKVTFSVVEPQSAEVRSMLHLPTSGEASLPLAFSSPELSKSGQLAPALLQSNVILPSDYFRRDSELTASDWSDAVIRRLSLEKHNGQSQVEEHDDSWLHHRSLPNIQEAVEEITTPLTLERPPVKPQRGIKQSEHMPLQEKPKSPSGITECPFKWPTPPSTPPVKKPRHIYRLKKRSPANKQDDQESSGSDKSWSGVTSEDDEPKRNQTLGAEEMHRYSSSSLSSYWSAVDVISGPGRPSPASSTFVAATTRENHKDDSLLYTTNSAFQSNSSGMLHQHSSSGRQTFAIAEEDERVMSDADTAPLLDKEDSREASSLFHHYPYRLRSQSDSTHSSPSVILNISPIDESGSSNKRNNGTAFFSRNPDVR